MCCGARELRTSSVADGFSAAAAVQLRAQREVRTGTESPFVIFDIEVEFLIAVARKAVEVLRERIGALFMRGREGSSGFRDRG